MWRVETHKELYTEIHPGVVFVVVLEVEVAPQLLAQVRYVILEKCNF